MRSLFKRIEIRDYQVQARSFYLYLLLLLFVWLLILFFVFFNRYTYSNKRIDIHYYHSNLSDNSINAVIPASEIMDGDNLIIENYLAEYVKIRETVIPDDFINKDAYIRAYSSHQIWSMYSRPLVFFRKDHAFLLRSVAVQNVSRLDDTLFQVHYKLSEKADYRSSDESIRYMIATVRYNFASIHDDDSRLKNPFFTIINPLSVEVVVYTTAERVS